MASGINGQVPDLERLRCHLCGCIYTAALPAEAGPDKYDPTVASGVATLRYGEGMPRNHLQRMQRMAGVPLPASVQWELVRDAAERGPRDAYQHLLDLAAQGDLVHNGFLRPFSWMNPVSASRSITSRIVWAF